MKVPIMAATHRLRVSAYAAYFLFFCVVSGYATAAVRYVDIDAASGGNGLTWRTAFREIQPAIDAAYAAGGGEVWVAEGVYSEHRDSETGALYMRDGVSLYGGFVGTETARETADPEAHVSKIDGAKGLGGTPAMYTVVFANQCTLEGFSLEGAQWYNVSIESNKDCFIGRSKFKSSGIDMNRSQTIILKESVFYDCTFPNSGIALSTGGCKTVNVKDCIFKNNKKEGKNSIAVVMITATEELTLRDCVFEGNRADAGGALYINTYGTSEISDCIFKDNAGTYGGALFIRADDTLVTNCVFKGNSASESGGAVEIFTDHMGLPSVRFEKCLFEDNSALYGGGISYLGDVILLIDRFDIYSVVANCIFRGNVATGGWGNALYATHFAGCLLYPDEKDRPFYEDKNGFPEEGIRNTENTFEKIVSRNEDAGEEAENNTADKAMCAPSGSSKYFISPFFWPLMIVNCSFVENGISSNSSTIHANSNYEALYLYNCLFWNNAATEDLGENGEIFEDYNGEYVDPTGMDPCELHYGEMAGCLFDVDPKFVDAANGDYRLQKDSPCIDTGVDTSTLRYGSVADDYLGRPRGIDGDLFGPNGAGDVDIGACEFVNNDCVILAPHSADMNCNGDFSLIELLRVIQIFNSEGYACADSPGDTEDGFVPGSGENHACNPHSSDYNPQDWQVDLSELLRLIQLFNAGGYTYCPDDNTEDGFCLKS